MVLEKHVRVKKWQLQGEQDRNNRRNLSEHAEIIGEEKERHKFRHGAEKSREQIEKNDTNTLRSIYAYREIIKDMATHSGRLD